MSAQQYTVQDMDILGQPYLWEVALNCNRQDVCQQAGTHLIRMYSSAVGEDASPLFIR